MSDLAGAAGRSLGSPFGGALLGALVIGVVEVAALGAGLALAATVLGLHAGLGLVVGAAMAATEWAARRSGLRPWAASALRAAPAAVPLAALGRTLFQGAQAATLPGAAWAPIGLPVLGVLGVACALYAADWWVHRGPALTEVGRQRGLAAALVLFVVAIEWGNRSLFRSGYPDAHLFGVLVSCTAAGAALRTVAAGAGRWRWWPAPVLSAGAALLWFVLALALGMQSAADRWTVATGGTHARHLSHALRGALDRDGDGFAAVLGGGDCDDGDAGRNPGARDVPGNGVDEDCDGRDAARVALARPGVELSEWLEGPEARALVERTRDMNIVIVAIDTLRADVLRAPGAVFAYPNIHGFVAGARRFRRAYAPSAGTDVSMGGFVTGRVDPFQRLETTLFEAARRAGHVTHGVVPREVLRYAGKTLLTRGLDDHTVIVNDPEQRDVGDRTTSGETTDAGLAFIDRVQREQPDRPFVLWLHYFDVHEHAQIEADDPRLRAVGGAPATPAGKYRALVRVVDRAVGRVLTELERRDLADDTIVVLFSDHGESLGEDARLPDKHGLYVYEPLIRVPLAVRVPGVEPGWVEQPVSLIDLMPTLVRLLGEPVPGEVDGVALLPHLVAEPPPELTRWDRTLVANESEQWAVIAWPHKLLVRPADNLIELYDLEADPAEIVNLASRRSDLVRELKQRYGRFPEVHLDRTRSGRRWRERRARPPASR